MKSHIKASTSAILILIFVFFLARTYTYYNEVRFMNLIEKNGFEFSDNFYFKKDGNMIYKKDTKLHNTERDSLIIENYLQLLAKYNNLNIPSKFTVNKGEFLNRNKLYDLSMSYKITKGVVYIQNANLNYHTIVMCNKSK